MRCHRTLYSYEWTSSESIREFAGKKTNIQRRIRRRRKRSLQLFIIMICSHSSLLFLSISQSMFGCAPIPSMLGLGERRREKAHLKCARARWSTRFIVLDLGCDQLEQGQWRQQRAALCQSCRPWAHKRTTNMILPKEEKKHINF